MNKSMRLITSAFKGQRTFKMIPITKDCPYIEVIFDVETKILAVIHNQFKQGYHLVAKLDDNGDIEMLKNGKRKDDPKKTYKEERRLMETYHEYYLFDKTEILEFINHFADNVSSYNVEGFFVIQTQGFDQKQPDIEVPKIILPDSMNEVQEESKTGS